MSIGRDRLGAVLKDRAGRRTDSLELPQELADSDPEVVPLLFGVGALGILVAPMRGEMLQGSSQASLKQHQLVAVEWDGEQLLRVRRGGHAL